MNSRIHGEKDGIRKNIERLENNSETDEQKNENSTE